MRTRNAPGPGKSPKSSAGRTLYISSGEQRAEYAYLRLRDAIASGRLESGERVREIGLAEWLNVSRTPIREALRRLESDGLLSRAPRGGLVVTALDPQQIHELYALRAVLEGMAARLAARHASESELMSLRDLIARQKAAIGDVQQLAVLNRHFHELLYRGARNRYLLQVLGSLRDALALLRDTTYSVADRPAAALEEHTRIVDALARRDADAADTSAREHIQMAANARLTLVLNSGAQPRGDESAESKHAEVTGLN